MENKRCDGCFEVDPKLTVQGRCYDCVRLDFDLVDGEFVRRCKHQWFEVGRVMKDFCDPEDHPATKEPWVCGNQIEGIRVVCANCVQGQELF